MTYQLFWNRNRSYTQAQEVLEHYLPPDGSGYIRQLKQSDVSDELFIAGAYGFFRSDGECIQINTSYQQLRQLALTSTFVLHSYN